MEGAEVPAAMFSRPETLCPLKRTKRGHVMDTWCRRAQSASDYRLPRGCNWWSSCLTFQSTPFKPWPRNGYRASGLHIPPWKNYMWKKYPPENFNLRGYYATSSGNFLPTIRDKTIGPETLVRNYYYSLSNSPEKRNFHLLRSGSLKSECPADWKVRSIK
jgi:hypothetical protein